MILPGRRGFLIVCVGLLSVVSASGSADVPPRGDPGDTWVGVEGEVYGAKPDERGPIGGGEGYVSIVTSGDYTVQDLDSLLEALSKAKPGEVVFIPGGAESDLTARIYIEELVLKVGEGVTLASDRGHNGSQGALLTVTH